MNDRSDALLRAHVEFEIARLRGPALRATIGAGASEAFEWFQSVTLNEVITSEQIVGIIDRYVIHLQVSGGITELAGQMANAVFSSPAADGTRIADILSPVDYEQFATKIAGLTAVQRQVLRSIAQSASFASLASKAISRLGTGLLFPAGEQAGAAGRIADTARRLFPSLEHRVATALERLAERHALRMGQTGQQRLADALDPEWVRQTADEIWDVLSDKPLSDARTVLDSQDLEDFIVLGYEFWLKFRKTPYFKAVSTEVVERLFEKYGNESVYSIIEDMGVTEDMLARELRGFLPPLLEAAHRTGFLERVVRSRLAAFYESAAAREVLAWEGA